MQRHTDQLKQESYHLLVAGKLYFGYRPSGNNDVDTVTKWSFISFFSHLGESGAGKSSLINLILEEKLLPTAMLPTKSPICELKYGKERKIVLHYKEADSKEKKREETFSIVDPVQIKSYVDGAFKSKDSVYEKVEIFWPHQLLEVC